MVLRTTFLHMEKSKALEDFARKKILSRIERKAHGPVDVQLSFALVQHLHKAKLVLKDKVGERIVVEQIDTDMYGAVNKLAGSLDRALVKRKGRLLRRRFGKAQEPEDAGLVVNDDAPAGADPDNIE